MITGNSLKIAKPNGSDEMILADAPEGQFDGFWLNIAGTITAKEIIAAGSQADVNDLLAHVISSLTLEDRLASGPKGNGRQVYEAADGSDMRRIHKFVTRTEVECNLLGAAIANAADFDFLAKLYIPFSVPWLTGPQKRPGHTQVRNLFLKIVEKNEKLFGGAGARFERKAGTFTTYEVEYDAKPGPDQIVSLFTLARVTEPRKIMRGPPGVTLLAYETTPLGTTPLKSFKVRMGDGPAVALVHDVRSPQTLAQQFKLDHQDVDQDITTDGTPFYWVEEGIDLEELPHGEVTFEQANQDLAPINGRFFYYPEHDSDEIRVAIGRAAIEKKRPVLGSITAISNPRAHPGAAATAAIVLHETDDARFVTESGMLGLTNGQVQTVVPPTIQATAAAAAGALKGEGSNVAIAALRRFDKLTALRIPGATDSNGRGKGLQREEVRGLFARAHSAAR
jgi:hypothetical protein